MIKNIAYYPSQCAKNAPPVLDAFLQGCASHGIATVANSWDADAAVIWSVLWSGRMQANRGVFEHYRNLQKPVIIVEVGALQRGRTWKIAVNHVTRQGYYGHTNNLDWDRPARLGLKLNSGGHRGRHVLIAMQHARSLQTQDINMEQWLRTAVKAVRRFSDRPIVVRPHPRSAIVVPNDLAVSLETPRRIPHTYDSFDIDLDCHAVVNINSGPGIMSAVSGVRPVVYESSLAYPVRCDLADLEKPYVVDRSQWLVEICHTEYTVEEIEQGLWIPRIEPALTVPV